MGNFTASVLVYSHAVRAGYILLFWSKDQELE